MLGLISSFPPKIPQEIEEEPKKWFSRGRKTKNFLDSLAKWYLRVFNNPPRTE
jgi:hypothetical protein